MEEFKDQTVLITGASSGIGRACALEFAKTGASLLLLGRKPNLLHQLAHQCEALGAKVETFAFDLTNEVDCEKFFLNLRSLDIAVNNAGWEGALGDIVDLKLKDYDTLMQVNVRSLWLCLQKEILYFRKNNKPGIIINISSIAGRKGIAHSSLYCASKHAVEGLTKSLALEQAPYGIRIDAIAPGAIETPMLERVLSNTEIKLSQKRLTESIPAQRLGKAAEIAQGILWLASKKSSYVVGQSLVIDGGKTL